MKFTLLRSFVWVALFYACYLQAEEGTAAARTSSAEATSGTASGEQYIALPEPKEGGAGEAFTVRGYLENLLGDWVENQDYRKELFKVEQPQIPTEVHNEMIQKENWLTIEYERQRRMYQDGSGMEDIEATALMRDSDGKFYAPFETLEEEMPDQTQEADEITKKLQNTEVKPLENGAPKYKPILKGFDPVITGSLLTEENPGAIDLGVRSLEGMGGLSTEQNPAEVAVVPVVDIGSDPEWINESGLPDDPSAGILAEVAGTYPAIIGYVDPVETYNESLYPFASSYGDPLLGMPGSSPRLDPTRPSLLLNSDGGSSIAQLISEGLLSPMGPRKLKGVNDTISKDVRDRILTPEVPLAQPVETVLTPRQERIVELQEAQKVRRRNRGQVRHPFDGFR